MTFLTFRCLTCGTQLVQNTVAEHVCEEPPERQCSVCGLPESESQWSMLIPIEVITNEGEEGFADVVQLLCDDHFIVVAEGLMKLGFKDHRHGGANFLEDEKCPGRRDMYACPTPTEYGQVIVPGGGW